MAKPANKRHEAKHEADLGFILTLPAGDPGNGDAENDSEMLDNRYARGSQSFFDDLGSFGDSDDTGRLQYDKIIKFAKRKATECFEAPNKVLNDKIADARMRLHTDDSRSGALSSKKATVKLHATASPRSDSNAPTEPKDRVLIKDQIRKRAGKKAVTSAVDVVDAVNDNAHVDTSSFTSMGLARSLLKAVSQLGFASPTPVQAATIPIALTGRDICACAATGTGKTAAYVLPILERIVQNMKVEIDSRGEKENAVDERATRVLVLLPTRELAVQVFTVTDKMAAHAGDGLTVALAAGGMDIKRQALELQTRPTIVIATPGRLLDHAKASVLTNTTVPADNEHRQRYAFSLQKVEILVLDEADRMLDESFEEQIREIIQLLPPVASRQTMLFSATMSDDVLALAQTLLNNPQKIICNEEAVMSAPNLQQEFLRVRQEASREALLAALVMRHFLKKTLIFVATKAEAHRLHVILGLLGVSVGELHGNLSQGQRLDTLQRFREERELDVLVATDVAARGLDIPQVLTVINYRMPRTLKAYIHRVGRTARAGRAGRSVSLVGETERKLLRQVVQASKEPLTSRSIAPEVISKYRAELATLDKVLNEILQAENPSVTDDVKKSKVVTKNAEERDGDAVDGDGDDEGNEDKVNAKKVHRKPQKLKKNVAVPVTLFKKKLTRKMKRRAEVKNRHADQQQSKSPKLKRSQNSRNPDDGKQPIPALAAKRMDKKRQGGKHPATAFGIDLSRGRQRDY